MAAVASGPELPRSTPPLAARAEADRKAATKTAEYRKLNKRLELIIVPEWNRFPKPVSTTFYACPRRFVKSSALANPRNTEEIFRAAKEEDESAHHVLDRAFEYLAAAIIGFLHMFDPELLILGGSIATAGPQMLNSIRDQVARRTRILLVREVPIVFQETVGYGGVAGAAGLVFLQQGLLTI